MIVGWVAAGLLFLGGVTAIVIGLPPGRRFRQGLRDPRRTLAGHRRGAPTVAGPLDGVSGSDDEPDGRP
jgi:hypothetical protein